MPFTPTPVSEFPVADLPLTGDEFVPIVQDGITKKTTVAGLGGGPITTLGGEEVFVAVAGNNNNIPLDIAVINRVLIDTTAGAAILTGVVAGTDGQLLVVTRQGPNSLTLNNQDAGSDPDAQLYGAVNLTLLDRQSRLLSYSGTLSKWVMV